MLGTPSPDAVVDAVPVTVPVRGDANLEAVNDTLDIELPERGVRITEQREQSSGNPSVEGRR
ncbi:hypothetical protein [Haladaptatus sp. DYF46]|uniref:hypothetical protein n=1 Tax=Haladaptatus sp. DYF46 TaxID=2886041 RepID=UPI001E3BAE72|nr:hypothetical protein [Haladaptatus sp. DYF46]